MIDTLFNLNNFEIRYRIILKYYCLDTFIE